MEKEEETQKFSVLFREIEKRGQIENFWTFDLKQQIKNDKKYKKDRTIEVEIRKDAINRLQPGEKSHTIYKYNFIREMISTALALHGNNATETPKFLGSEKSGFSH